LEFVMFSLVDRKIQNLLQLFHSMFSLTSIVRLMLHQKKQNKSVFFLEVECVHLLRY
jgi:hypothetical protein